jgi:hypothetical protein
MSGSAPESGLSRRGLPGVLEGDEERDTELDAEQWRSKWANFANTATAVQNSTS